jgi:AraC-like DNA-binding protein
MASLRAMTLDRLFTNIVVNVEPFALCQVNTGWRLGLPGPPDVMFHFVLQGSGIMRGPGGEPTPIYPYTLGVVPLGVVHTIECGNPIESEETIDCSPPPGSGVVTLNAGTTVPADLSVACGVVHVAYGDVLGLFQNLKEIVIADLSGYPQVRSAFEGMMEEQKKPSIGSDALASAYMNQCLVYLLRHLSRHENRPIPWLSALEDPALARSVDAMISDVGAHHTVESLSEIAVMSRSVFSDRFHEAFGCTPMNFLRDLRLRRSIQLLQTNPDLSVKQIAHRVGFSSRSHFTSVFTGRFGVAPAAYRSVA